MTACREGVVNSDQTSIGTVPHSIATVNLHVLYYHSYRGRYQLFCTSIRHDTCPSDMVCRGSSNDSPWKWRHCRNNAPINNSRANSPRILMFNLVDDAGIGGVHGELHDGVGVRYGITVSFGEPIVR